MKYNVLIIYAVILIAIIAFILSQRSKMKNINSISAVDAFELSQKNNALAFIDARTEGEYNHGHIKGALSGFDAFSPTTINSKLALLDKSETYIIYCASGHRSIGVYKKFKSAGFENIYNLAGGFGVWKYKNLPQEK